MNQLQREAEEEALMSGKADLPLQQQMEFSDKDMEEETPGMTLLDQELLQEKQDQIDTLHAQLEKERERLHQCEIQVANLREELDIQIAKGAGLINERDGYQAKLKESINKMSQFRDIIADKDDKVEQLSSKIEILVGENQQLKEANEKLLQKISFIQDNHILIPTKEGHRVAQEKSDDSKLQDEVRRLHFQLKQKDAVIDKFKSMLEARGSAQEDDQQSLKRIQSLIDRDEAIEQPSKEYEKEVLSLLTSSTRNILTEEDYGHLTRSLLLEPKDFLSVIYAQNELKLQLSDLESRNMHLEVHLNDIKAQLVRESQAPNIGELSEQLAKERIDEERKKWEHARDQLTKDLQNRVEKVLELEMELDEVKDAYRALESTLSRDDMQLKNRA